MTTEKLLPNPDHRGIYRYPDGCAIWPSGVRDTFKACWADGSLLTGVNDQTYYFGSAEEAAQELANGGEGPGRQGDNTTPPLPDGRGAAINDALVYLTDLSDKVRGSANIWTAIAHLTNALGGHTGTHLETLLCKEIRANQPPL